VLQAALAMLQIKPLQVFLRDEELGLPIYQVCAPDPRRIQHGLSAYGWVLHPEQAVQRCTTAFLARYLRLYRRMYRCGPSRKGPPAVR
jgi:hypothetical protein